MIARRWVAGAAVVVVAAAVLIVWLMPFAVCVRDGGRPYLFDRNPWAKGGLEVGCEYGPARVIQ